MPQTPRTAPPTSQQTPPATGRPPTSPRPSPPPPADVLALPYYSSDSVPAAQIPDVQIVTDPARTCVWLQRANGDRVAALWPQGYRARFAPLRVYDHRDQLVWTELEVRTAGGGLSEVYVERLPEQCRTGRYAWWVAP